MRRLLILTGLMVVVVLAVFTGTPAQATAMCSTSCSNAFLSCTATTCSSVSGTSITCDGVVTTCSAANTYCNCSNNCDANLDACLATCDIKCNICGTVYNGCIRRCGTQPPNSSC